jgi:hypothetical protein
VPAFWCRPKSHGASFKSDIGQACLMRAKRVALNVSGFFGCERAAPFRCRP